jgi:3-oxocholest-4-en-26-oate---CoA ligase
MMHFAPLFEAIAAAQPGAPALLHAGRSMTWQRFDEDADALAAWMASIGIIRNAKVALLLYNGPEYLTAQYAAFKISAVPVNVNYRYLDDELVYLFDNSDSEIVFFDATLADRIERIRPRCPLVRAWVRVGHGSPTETGAVAGTLTYNDLIASFSGEPVEPRERHEDEIYLLYTGGTTGMPKGVMFRMGDFVRRMFTGYTYRGWELPEMTVPGVVDAVQRLRDSGHRRVSIPACPLMHGTGMWLGSLYAHLMGGSVATLMGRRLDVAELWKTAERTGADSITIVGDAFARPMLDELDRAIAAGRPYQLESLRIIQSSGAMLSAEVQRGLLGHLDIRIVDSMGSTEGGIARRIATRASAIETAKFELIPGTIVVTDDGRQVVPGSGELGRVAASAVVPLGYYKDPAKSETTFVVIGDRRYAMAGDWATIEADGSLTLLGRGSNCVNTGGEKVFPEEVEEALKRHPDVVDALVVGMPDERLGQRVAAVVSLRGDIGEAPPVDQLVAFVRTQIAAYKAPRSIVFVPTVQRAPNGKADYVWAASVVV